MATPINGETFLPQLIADYLEAQRTALGLPTALTLAPWPYLGEYSRPMLGIEASQFKFAGHPATQEFEVMLALDYGVEGEPARTETAAQKQTRLVAALAAENSTLALIRAAMALRTGQTVTFDGSVASLFDWVTDTRDSSGDSDHWALEDIVPSGGGGSINYEADKRQRIRVTTYVARIRTNEFTV